MSTKIIITGFTNISKLEVGKALVKLNDNLSIAQTYYNGVDINKEYTTVIDKIKMYMIYENNAFLYVSKHDDVIKGITLEDFYNNDIFIMETNEFNNIPSNILAKNDIIVIWLDSKYYSKENINNDLIEVKYLIEQLNYTRYMYFLDESINDIANTILEYINADEQGKQRLLEEYL